MPELSQLRNYIAKVKAKKGPVGKITMNQLKDACQKYLEVPADIDHCGGNSLTRRRHLMYCRIR